MCWPLLPPKGAEAFQQETIIVMYLFQRIPCQATKDRLKVERRVREEGARLKVLRPLEMYCRVYEGVTIYDIR